MLDEDMLDSMEDVDKLVFSARNLRLSPSNSDMANDEEEADARPRSLIVTNVDQTVFDNEYFKCNFEGMFREFESCATFHYLRSFRRIRVDFSAHDFAAAAKAAMDSVLVGDYVIRCFFIEFVSPDDHAFLSVPPVEKLFLLSPPCSPPVGWEQPKESHPVIDYDLLAAMAQLAPGEKHELQAGQDVQVYGKSVSLPSIVVQVADDDDRAQYNSSANRPYTKIVQTKCPERKSSIE